MAPIQRFDISRAELGGANEAHATTALGKFHYFGADDDEDSGTEIARRAVVGCGLVKAPSIECCRQFGLGRPIFSLQLQLCERHWGPTSHARGPILIRCCLGVAKEQS